MKSCKPITNVITKKPDEYRMCDIILYFNLHYVAMKKPTCWCEPFQLLAGGKSQMTSPHCDQNNWEQNVVMRKSP